jgi:small subunit ribosomal protein S17
MTRPGELRDLTLDDLRQREHELDDQLFRMRLQKAMGLSDRMDKSVVVAIERQVRHGVYGKTQRLTSRFMAHDEGNEAKVGDRVALVESRPLSHRKRWVVTRVVEKAPAI